MDKLQNHFRSGVLRQIVQMGLFLMLCSIYDVFHRKSTTCACGIQRPGWFAIFRKAIDCSQIIWKMKKGIFLLPVLFFFAACQPRVDLEELKASVAETETSFAQMAADSGIAKAFFHFADDKAVIMRGNKIIPGRDGIRSYIESRRIPGSRLEWFPTFVDVAKAGDMAYTYGDYTFSYPDSTGTMQSTKGIFHTVWKRQDDGSWRFVWD